jgi:hypothetical protein
MTVVTSDNRYGVAQLIVAPTLAQGANYTTIASALTAAVSGQTIFIRPGTYTEDLTLKAGVNLTAFDCDAFTPNVTIVGNATFTAAGSVSISGIRLQTNSAAFLTISGSAASIVWLTECYLNCTNSTGIILSTSDSGGAVRIQNCFGNIGTTGISLFTSTSPSSIIINDTTIVNNGSSTTSSSLSEGLFRARYCSFNIPFTTSSTGTINFYGVFVDTSGTNTTCITTAGTSVSHVLAASKFDAGTGSSISIGSGTLIAMSDCSISSTNANAITGAGTLVHTGLSYINTSSVINTTTVTNRNFGRTGTFTPVLNFGGATTGITYSQQFGQFTQMGDRVDFTIVISLSNKGSATGNATITGFPITVGTVGAVAAMGYYGIITLTATYTTLSLQMNGGATTANLIQSNEIGSGQIFTTHLNYANTSLFTVTGFYFTT